MGWVDYVHYMHAYTEICTAGRIYIANYVKRVEYILTVMYCTLTASLE